MFNTLFTAFEAEGEELFFVGGFVRDFEDARWQKDLHECNLRMPNITEEDRQKYGSLPDAVEEFWKKVRAGTIDVDFATSALPEKTIQILKKAGLKPIPIGIEFGTIQTFIGDLKIEITTFRCNESYKKGSRKPSVQFGKTIQEDLARRDFTINAMAMDKNFNTIDPFGGRMNLVEGLLFTPISPDVSFSDDPLRMLRACRFHAKISGLSWEIGESMQRNAHLIKDISSERVFEEVSKILMTNHPDRGLTAMVSTGLMAELFPELQTVVEFQQNQGKWHSKLVWPHTLDVVRQSPAILEVRWAALFHDVAKPQTYTETETGVHFYGHDWKGQLVWDQVARRLRVSNEFRDHVGQLVFEHLQPSLLSAEGVNHVSDKALRRLAHRLGDRLDNLFHLSAADISSHNPDVVAQKKSNCLALRERVRELLEKQETVRMKLPSGTGTVLAEALGLKPGPELGKVMRALEQKLIDGEISLEADFVEEAKKLQVS